MFREMRRNKQQVSDEICRKILREEWRGVLAVHGEDGYPYALPIDFYYDEEKNKIYFHCAKEGHKLDALRADSRVSFCVYDKGFRKEGDWALNITSVIIFGRIRIIDDPEETRVTVRRFGEKFFPTKEELENEILHSLARV
ncbi:MAG: pyridoxamine 5'-phosphate oxidase family protein, partial [Clostridia bacterium]|nr:pyridoxamine 5'-phosphate oxidase family protein [Clostridia bacterium]